MLQGLGRRFRFYKYTPGAVYKPHIDGAWAGSGVDSEGGYLLDAYGALIYTTTIPWRCRGLRSPGTLTVGGDLPQTVKQDMF
eukprot:7217402-Pyramimonas_sp.AAC.1